MNIVVLPIFYNILHIIYTVHAVFQKFTLENAETTANVSFTSICESRYHYNNFIFLLLCFLCIEFFADFNGNLYFIDSRISELYYSAVQLFILFGISGFKFFKSIAFFYIFICKDRKKCTSLSSNKARWRAGTRQIQRLVTVAV